MVKAAISVDATLLRRAQVVAHEMEVSRSRLFAMAVREFIERQRNRELLRATNAAWATGTEPGEKRLLRLQLRQHRKLVRGQW